MRQLLPVPAEVDPYEAHAQAERQRPDSGPWVLANMVASIDGATTVEGVSGGLGSPADKAVFSALRSVADVILVGAATVRAEGYGPPRTPERAQADRVERGQSPFPRIAVVSGSLDLDPASPMFTEAAKPPIIVTTSSAPLDGRQRLAPIAEIVEVDGARVSAAAAVGALAEFGAKTVLTEGGPGLLGQLVAAGLVDEMNLTLSPTLVAGTSARVAQDARGIRQDMTLAHLWESNGVLLARYLRAV